MDIVGHEANKQASEPPNKLKSIYSLTPTVLIMRSHALINYFSHDNIIKAILYLDELATLITPN